MDRTSRFEESRWSRRSAEKRILPDRSEQRRPEDELERQVETADAMISRKVSRPGSITRAPPSDDGALAAAQVSKLLLRESGSSRASRMRIAPTWDRSIGRSTH